MNDDPSVMVRKLLIEGQGVPERKVTPGARILHDLGVDGDDAGEICGSAWKRDPGSGVIGVEKGPLIPVV